jgi:hypothetical protein
MYYGPGVSKIDKYIELLEKTRSDGRRMKPKEHLLLGAQLGALTTQDYKESVGGPVPYSMIEFVDEWCSKSEFGRQFFGLQKIDPGGFREAMHTMHKAARWAQQGFSVFDLSHDLAAGFLLTDPPPLPEDGLKLPFDCFCIKVPPGIVPMFIEGEQVWAQLIWVHQFRSVHHERGECDFLRVAVEHKGIKVWRDRYPTELTEESDETIFNRPVLGDPEYLDEDRLSPAAGIHILRNFISWLDAEKPAMKVETRKKKKGKKAKRIEESGAFPRVYLMGKSVKLRPELKRMASEIALAGSKKHHVEGWQLRSRHIVRGHWKSQPYGPGRSLRKQVRIEPYWRGPEGSDVWAHLYSDD